MQKGGGLGVEKGGELELNSPPFLPACIKTRVGPGEVDVLFQ